MRKPDLISMCALVACSMALACASRKTAAEAQAAETFQPASVPTPEEDPEPAPPADPGAPPETGDSPGTADDTWTDEPGDQAATSSTAAPATTNQPETRTMEVIRQFVLERREKVRPCYDKAQAGRPNFKGDIMMRFVLSPSGVVQSIEYSPKESSLYAPDVGECIAREMKTWQFPASSRGMETKVGYPFNFNPRSK